MEKCYFNFSCEEYFSSLKIGNFLYCDEYIRHFFIFITKLNIFKIGQQI